MLASLLMAACASTTPPSVHIWRMAQEQPLARICLAPCNATFRVSQYSGPPACPSILWLVQNEHGETVFRSGRDADCLPDEPSPRFRFIGEFPRGSWTVLAEVTVAGQIVAKPWRDLEVR